MNRTDAMAWVLTVCAQLRLSQAKTRAELVAAARHVGRVSLAALGRHVAGPTSAKHRIKRTWRLVANPRVEVGDAMRGVVGRLVPNCTGSRQKETAFLGRRCRKTQLDNVANSCKQVLVKRRKKPLLVGFDWTEVRGFCTLMAAAVLKGRAIPLVRASYPQGVLDRSQNNFEAGLWRVLRTLIPEAVPVIRLADRGFGRTALARTGQFLGFHYAIRIRPDVWIVHPEFAGKLLDYPVRRGLCQPLAHVQYRKHQPVCQHIVVRWKLGLPEQRDEPWFLMTDLRRSPRALSELYGRRMTVEELFRDDKNRRNGFALRATQLTRAERIDRLLLILALAYILLVGLGLRARQRYRPGAWCRSNRPPACSAFTIGRIMLERMKVRAVSAFAATIAATLELAPKWG